MLHRVTKPLYETCNLRSISKKKNKSRNFQLFMTKKTFSVSRFFLSERKWSFIANKKARRRWRRPTFSNPSCESFYTLINYLLQVKSTFYYHWKGVVAGTAINMVKPFYTCVYCSVWHFWSCYEWKDSLRQAIYTCIYSRCRLMWSVWSRQKVITLTEW